MPLKPRIQHVQNDAQNFAFAGGRSCHGDVGSIRGNRQTQVGKNKVIFQVSDGDPQKWNLALNNVKNLQDELRTEGAELEIVAYGPGIGMLKDDSIVATKIADALKGGVKVVACENTMKAQKLGHADMLPAIGYVPAGVVELMRRQQDGYAYIRP